ncbi:hypothetical protein HOD15_03835 [Candidatus Peregrinibacteria bacterium]|jgi:hypothetical protein|nr:hypothetical protein [Candidatus Peregrinibacteria bacterium]
MKKGKCCMPQGCPQSSCMAYMLGLIGAAVFYIGAATSFGMGVVGFLKALVWPAFLVYELLTFVVA